MAQIKLLTIQSREWSLQEQLEKISEEHYEVLTARKPEHTAEELLDLMQACKTALEIMNNLGLINLEFENLKHVAKLSERASFGLIKLLPEVKEGEGRTND